MNADMNTSQIRKICEIDFDSEAILEVAMEKLGLSARAHSRILKISRTFADLIGEERINSDYVAEAIQYRSLARMVFRYDCYQLYSN
jgi:magnesium chelatase family protein